MKPGLSVALVVLSMWFRSERAVVAQTTATVLQSLSFDEVKVLVEREFGGLFVLNVGPERKRDVAPAWVVGDFNGDGVQDVAVLAQPSFDEFHRLSLQELESRPSRFALFKPLLAGTSARRVGDEHLRTKDLITGYENNIVLLIVHGRKSRPASATSHGRFALVDFYDAGAVAMTVSRRPLTPAAAGDALTPPPRLRGDSIRLLNTKGRGTAIYWDGRTYRWYPVE